LAWGRKEQQILRNYRLTLAQGRVITLLAGLRQKLLVQKQGERHFNLDYLVSLGLAVHLGAVSFEGSVPKYFGA
jgi:hypothetical protein